MRNAPAGRAARPAGAYLLLLMMAGGLEAPAIPLPAGPSGCRLHSPPRPGPVSYTHLDESVEAAFADSLDYYYVPTFYVDGQKRMEGVPSLEKVRAVLDEALDGEGE